MEGVGQFHVDRDACKGSTNTPKGTTLRTTKTPEPLSFTKESVSDFIAFSTGYLDSSMMDPQH